MGTESGLQQNPVPILQGPAWDLTPEYPSISDPLFEKDLAELESLTARLERRSADLKADFANALSTGEAAKPVIEGLQEMSSIIEKGMTLAYNLLTFVNCELSVDARNEKGQKALSVVQQKMSALETAQTAHELFLTRCSSSILEEYLKSPRTEPERFLWEEKRRIRDWYLSEDEERTLSQFRQHGPTAFGELYDQISGALKVSIPSKGEVGLAEASGYLRSPSEALRREAWVGIQEAWKSHQEAVAAILNGLAGWRLEEYRKRSSKTPIHFLDQPLVNARIERATLDALMGAIQQEIEIPRRALRAMAKCLGKSRVDPWDLLAPSPKAPKDLAIPFEEGLAKVQATFADIDPEAGKFIQRMAVDRRIEGRVLPNKRQGAYCTNFMKSRRPVVFQTYMGSLEDISTLAHELGHAYHSWVMRDLPLVQTDYPMTLAETASTFAETALSDSMMATGTPEMRFELAWSAIVDAVSLLLNIPARFDFEKSFYEKRESGFVSPRELCELTDQAWRKWYGGDLSQTEDQFWMTKLHFSIADRSFYNFPYAFGFLFSLSIYSRRERMGEKFGASYQAILRDTGRMTAEKLIEKHLGEDIRRPEFWLKSLEIVDEKVSAFEKLLSSQ